MPPDYGTMKVVKTRALRVHLDQSWSKAIFAFLAILVSTAALKNSGLLYVGFMAEFGINREDASWPSSVIASAIHGAGGCGGTQHG